MVNFDNVTSNVQSKPRKKTMAESLEEAKQEGKLVVPEEDTQVNAVVSSETIQPKNKARKKKQSKVRKQEEQTNAISQANEDNDFKDAKTDKRGVPVGINVPQHIIDVVCIVKFNAAFRRHTSFNILHALEDDGRICNSKGAYVDFLWNGECGIEGGDGHAEGTRVAALLSPPLHPINNTPNNQSKPIVPTPSYSLS